jgi:hypothetical protein
MMWKANLTYSVRNLLKLNKQLNQINMQLKNVAKHEAKYKIKSTNACRQKKT